tara:strand:- start:28124 stop:29677 length:1554 start_codon:yes stop_codon:yes gene_type:complete
MVNLNNSRRNRTDLVAGTLELKQVISELFEAYLLSRNHQGLRGLSDVQKDVSHRHLEMILCDLFAAWEGDPEKFIGYSRGKSNFVRGGSYWNSRLGVAFPARDTFVNLIVFLEEQGFLENHLAPQGGEGLSSRMRATASLVRMFCERQITWVHFIQGRETENIVVKDESKSLIPLDAAEGREGINLEQAEENLRFINGNLGRTFINLNVTDRGLAELSARTTGNDLDGNDFREPFEPSNRFLRRIFALGSFEFGGRFYGGWWQGIPSDMRKFIEIDGAVTREYDYSSMQPTLMYAQMGMPAPEDAYSLPGWPAEIRPLAKKAFNQLVNSDDSSRNPNQWHRFAPSILPDPLPRNWSEQNIGQKAQAQRAAFEVRYGRPYGDLFHDLMEFHAPIEPFFFSRSWGVFQRQDSDIAEQVMLRMLNGERSVTILPIHDSFIVRRGEEETLDRTMREVFEEVTGMRCNLKFEEAVYDRPEGNDGIHIVMADDLHEPAMRSIIEQTMYHRRWKEWEDVIGPLD